MTDPSKEDVQRLKEKINQAIRDANHDTAWFRALLAKEQDAEVQDAMLTAIEAEQLFHHAYDRAVFAYLQKELVRFFNSPDELTEWRAKRVAETERARKRKP